MPIIDSIYTDPESLRRQYRSRGRLVLDVDAQGESVTNSEVVVPPIQPPIRPPFKVSPLDVEDLPIES